MDPQVENYIRKKYGYSDDLSDDAFKTAMQQSRDGQLQANVGRAGATIGAAMGGIRPDYQFYDEMNQQAQGNVNDLVMRRGAQAKDLELQNAQMVNQNLQSDHDPNSPESQTLRRTWEKAIPGIAEAYGQDWQQVTAANKDLILKPLEFREQLNARRDAKHLVTQKHQEDQFDKAMSETVDRIEQSKMKGAVKSAWEAERLVNNAKDIINAYPNLDEMPQQQVTLLVDELGKIARGGAATEGSQHALMPNTVTSNFNSALSRLGNAPKGAEVGAFIKNYGTYLDDLKSNAKSMIGASIKSNLMARKRRSGDDEKIRQNYADYLDPNSKPNQAGRIRVSNGKETLDILPADLAHAQKEGFKAVGA